MVLHSRLAAQFSSRESGQNRHIDDSLPPFNALTNDEDRERKAEAYDPGTYHVVINPDSFLGLPEYSEHESMAESSSSNLVRDHSIREQSAESAQGHLLDVIEDPQVVVLRTFEDSSRRPSVPSQTRSPNSPASPSTTSGTISQYQGGLSTLSEATGLPGDSESSGRGERNVRLRDYYRNFVSRHVAHVHQYGSAAVTEDERIHIQDPFEEHCQTFRPLRHAMMALTQFSLAFREGTQSLEALQHYQQALPSLQTNLRSPRDLSSDGALFTHFFLLLYEIAAAEQSGSNLWLQHLTQLLRIITMRREIFGRERHCLLVWFVCVIDTYALLSSGGEGKFVATIIQNDLLPVSQDRRSTDHLGLPDSFRSEEAEIFPSVLRFNERMVTLATQLGQLARRVREESDQIRYPTQSGVRSDRMDVVDREGQLVGLQNTLRGAWRDEMPGNSASDWLQRSLQLPARVQAVFQHACAMYQACLIYSHTSMWPSQQDDLDPSGEAEIARCCEDILQLTKLIMRNKRLELRFISFPLFMAGFATTASEDKRLALDLMTTLEQESIGGNTASIRRLLQFVYERQRESLARLGHARGVDWISIMAEQGLQVVSFGL
ncbi:MAG: hypothetical protein M1837_000679 [Sclerophora amabilis]|nr:MAG: hypothetical protein M1837_000679 [Sclerophora amabilis]